MRVELVGGPCDGDRLTVLDDTKTVRVPMHPHGHYRARRTWAVAGEWFADFTWNGEEDSEEKTTDTWAER